MCKQNSPTCRKHVAEVMFERLFLPLEVADQQQEHGWQRASEDILSVVAKTTALNSVMSLLLSSCVLTQKRHHSPSHKPPSSPMGPTRCLGKEDPTVNTSTWHFLSASQGRRRFDPVCTDPSQKSRADQQLLQAGVSTPFLPVTPSWWWPINSTDRTDLTATFMCHLQAHEALR